MSTERLPGLAIRRGLVGRCPNCGGGRMFDGYLSVVPECPACGDPLGRYRAADGPAFFTMCIVGLMLIPIIGFGFAIWRPDPVVLLLWTGGIVLVLSFVVLRLVKGAFVALLWSRRAVDRGA